MSRSVMVIALLLYMPDLTWAQEPDPIAAKLDDSRKTFEAAVEKAKEKLLDALQVKEGTARKAGNRKAVEQIVAERETFEGDSTKLPKSIPTAAVATYQREVARSRDRMADIYKQAIKDYTKIGRDDEAKAIELEFEEFKRIATQEPADPLQPGTVWKGSRTFTKGPIAGQSVEFEVRITRRGGPDFAGVTIGAGQNAVDIVGKVGDGKVEWRPALVRAGSSPGQPHRGIIKENKLILKFEGTGTGGAFVAGDAEVTLQPQK